MGADLFLWLFPIFDWFQMLEKPLPATVVSFYNITTQLEGWGSEGLETKILPNINGKQI